MCSGNDAYTILDIIVNDTTIKEMLEMFIIEHN